MNYYFEFGGGLGDIFSRMFWGSEYRKIDEFLPEDRARITLMTVNPYADELFKWHPKRQQLAVTILPFWDGRQEQKKRQIYGLPPKMAVTRVKYFKGSVNFYAGPSDFEVIDRLKGSDYFILAASAGSNGRIFPDPIVSEICEEASKLRLTLVAVGRNFLRETRYEPKIPKNEFAIDLIDKLSVPGVAKLVEGAKGVICSFSSICLLSWFRDKPVLLLYPRHIYERFLQNPKPGIHFNLNRPTTHHSTFKSCNRGLIHDFFEMARLSYRENR